MLGSYTWPLSKTDPYRVIPAITKDLNLHVSNVESKMKLHILILKDALFSRLLQNSRGTENIF